MNLKHLSTILLRNLPFFVFSILIAIVGATLVNLTSPRVYESTTDIFISTPAAGLDVSTLVAGSTFSQQRVKSYAEIINSPMTLQPVIDKLKLSLSASELSRMVRSSAPLDTVIIKISVKNTDAYLASLLANAIARQFEITATNLEITDGAGSAQVKVSTVRESVPSIYPISPKTKLNYLFALVFAFLTSIGLGLLREIFDQTVKNESHISKPLLGVIDFDPEASNQPICYNNVYSSRSESYRQIRVNVLDYLDKHKLKTIAISSSISGEGKSSFSVNLAYTIALTGKKVCVIECDMRRPSLSRYLSGFTPFADHFSSEIGISGILGSKPQAVTLANIKRQIKKIAFPETNFYFIPCGEIPADPSEILTNKNLSKVLTILKRDYDVIIIDSPPTLPVGDSLLVGKCVDGVILLAKAGQVRKKQLMNTISFHENLGNNVFGICLNMAPLIDRAQEYGYQSSKHVYDSSYSYKNYYKAKSQAPYAPLDSEGGAKRSISQIIREIKQN